MRAPSQMFSSFELQPHIWFGYGLMGLFHFNKLSVEHTTSKDNNSINKVLKLCVMTVVAHHANEFPHLWKVRQMKFSKSPDFNAVDGQPKPRFNTTAMSIT